MKQVKLDDLTVTIDEKNRVLTSEWPDGTKLDAKPVYDDESIARARALGYTWWTNGEPDDKRVVWEMTRDHDLFHHLVARAEGEPWSWHLYYTAGGEMAIDDLNKVNGDREERLVFLLQRGANVGREGLLKDSHH